MSDYIKCVETAIADDMNKTEDDPIKSKNLGAPSKTPREESGDSNAEPKFELYGIDGEKIIPMERIPLDFTHDGLAREKWIKFSNYFKEKVIEAINRKKDVPIEQKSDLALAENAKYDPWDTSIAISLKGIDLSQRNDLLQRAIEETSMSETDEDKLKNWDALSVTYHKGSGLSDDYIKYKQMPDYVEDERKEERSNLLASSLTYHKRSDLSEDFIGFIKKSKNNKQKFDEMDQEEEYCPYKLNHMEVIYEEDENEEEDLNDKYIKTTPCAENVEMDCKEDPIEINDLETSSMTTSYKKPEFLSEDGENKIFEEVDCNEDDPIELNDVGASSMIYYKEPDDDLSTELNDLETSLMTSHKNELLFDNGDNKQFEEVDYKEDDPIELETSSITSHDGSDAFYESRQDAFVDIKSATDGTCSNEQLKTFRDEIMMENQWLKDLYAETTMTDNSPLEKLMLEQKPAQRPAQRLAQRPLLHNMAMAYPDVLRPGVVWNAKFKILMFVIFLGVMFIYFMKEKFFAAKTFE